MSDRPPRPPKEKPDAYAKALGLLARREHSARELAAKLERGGYAGDETADALGQLRSDQYQSDARFAGAIARTRSGQGYGPRRIAAELKSHAITDADIRSALDEVDCDWDAQARRQLQRQYGRTAPTDAKERARRAAFLLRRGFDAATVRALTRADVGVPGDEFD